jgi:high affinity sulfate transporter 1
MKMWSRSSSEGDSKHDIGRVWGLASSLARRLPGVQVGLSYQRDWLGSDMVAGLALTAVLVPQGMAYAELAGLPAVTGLYTTVLALLAYALFGPSRILVLGPDSALGPLIAAAILPLVGAHGNPNRAVALAGMLALVMGLVCVAAGLARLGTVAELLSKPVRIGYINGLAIVVVVSQLPKLFGFSTDARAVVPELRAFAKGVDDGLTSWRSLVIGLVCIAVILGIRHLSPRLPGVLIAVVGAAVAVAWFDLAAKVVGVVGPVPRGLPSPTWPGVGLGDLGPLVGAAVGLTFVTLADSTALTRTFALRQGQEVDTNAEIVALGAANLAAGVFQGFPLSASSTRTAVAESSGARTQMAGVVAALAIALILVFGNNLFRNLPSSSLAAVVIVAGLSLFDLASFRWLLRVRPTEFLLSAAALIGVVAFGALWGIVVAVGLSLAEFVRRAWRPYDAVLGRVPDTKGYHDLKRHPEAKQIPGLLIYRFDAPIFFANAEYLRRRVRALIDQRRAAGMPVVRLLLAAEPITDIDTTGAEALNRLLDELQDEGIDIAFAELKGPVKDRLRRYGLYERIRDHEFSPTLGVAIDNYLADTGVEWVDWTDRPPSPAEGDGTD